MEKHIRQITVSALLWVTFAVSPAWCNPPAAVYLPEETLKTELHRRAPLPDISVSYFEHLRQRRQGYPEGTSPRLRGQNPTAPLLLPASPATQPPLLLAPLTEDQDGQSLSIPSTTGIADLDKLIVTTKKMAEQAVLHHSLAQVHAGQERMDWETLLEHWEQLQKVQMPDPFFVEANRSAMLSLFLDRYQTFAFERFESIAQARGIKAPQRGWFLDAMAAVDPQRDVWPLIWERAPGSFSDKESLRAVSRRAFLKAQEALVETMADKYLATYLAQNSIQDFESVFPLSKSLRTAPHQQEVFDWLTARASTAEELGRLLEVELWDAAFLRFAGDIADENADPTEKPTRQHSEATGWSFPEELLFGKVLMQLLERAESALSLSPAQFLADVFNRLLGEKRPPFLNFMLETYLFHIEKLLENGSLQPSAYSAMELHLKDLSRELFARAPEPLQPENRWCRSLGQYALMLFQEATVLSRGWYPPTAKSMAEIFELSTSNDTEPFLRSAARSALASFVPTMLDRTMEALQGELPKSQAGDDFVTTMRSCIGLLAQAADQANELKN